MKIVHWNKRLKNMRSKELRGTEREVRKDVRA